MATCSPPVAVLTRGRLQDGTVRLWDMYSLMPLGELHVHDAAVEGLLVVPESGEQHRLSRLHV